MRLLKRIFLQIGIVTFCLLLTFGLFAQDKTNNPLSYNQWKNQQILNAENQLTRINNEIHWLRKTTGNINKINKLDISQRVALENLELVRNFTIEDYFHYYLQDFSDHDKALFIAAQKMSKKETAMLLKALLRERQQIQSGSRFAAQESN